MNIIQDPRVNTKRRQQGNEKQQTHDKKAGTTAERNIQPHTIIRLQSKRVF